MALETPTFIPQGVTSALGRTESDLFWIIIKTKKKKNSRKTWLTESQVNTDLKLLWKVVMASPHDHHLSHNESLHFDLRYHFCIKQSLKMGCFEADPMPHLYRPYNPVDSYLSQPAPICIPPLWYLETYYRSKC